MNTRTPPMDTVQALAPTPVRYMQEGMERYVFQGILPGSFLTALLTNNLSAAFSCADNQNLRNMALWVQYIHNHTPSTCHGSLEAVNNWKGTLHDDNNNN